MGRLVRTHENDDGRYDPAGRSALQEIRKMHRSDPNLDTVSEDAANPVPEAIPQV